MKTPPKKPWSGRFTEPTAQSVEDYTESVSFDSRLWPHDIQGSIAHARMLGHKGIIPKKDSDAIMRGLSAIAKDIEAGRFKFKRALEDVHMNIEAELTRRIGPAGGKLHTARSRNDQVALDLRLYLRHELDRTDVLLRSLCLALLTQAEKHTETLMPGYTHLQRAQPVLLAHYLLAYVEMFDRDRSRLADARKRINVLPLGSAALAGTSLPIDRAMVARELGFDGVTANSIDTVADRDFALEFLSDASIIMMHLSRLSEEIVLWATEEFGFLKLPDAYTTGSSIMPQKKNPDVAELTRGKTGRVYGSLVGLLTIMKALPLAYNRDMQEDKPLLFDAVDTVKAALAVMSEMSGKMRFDVTRMKTAASGGGFSTATDIAEYLVRKGMPFREAHEVTGRIVTHCLDKGKTLLDMSAAEYEGFSKLLGPDLRKLLTAEASAASRRSEGGTAKSEVLKQIKRMKGRLKK